MARQEEVFIQTISAMKKATARRDDASDSDDSIRRPTNRGNKLKRKAKFVEARRLDTTDGPRTLKKRILFNGYARPILCENPPRVDLDGDVIEYPEDSESDMTSAEDHPYAKIQLQNLLMPLTAPGNLKRHPSLSQPYTSKAIEDILRNAEEMLQREQDALWRLKQLTSEFRGDQTWVPCGAFQTETDPFLLGHNHFSPSGPSSVELEINTAQVPSSEANWDTMANVRLMADLQEASMDGSSVKDAPHDAYEASEVTREATEVSKLKETIQDVPNKLEAPALPNGADTVSANEDSTDASMKSEVEKVLEPAQTREVVVTLIPPGASTVFTTATTKEVTAPDAVNAADESNGEPQNLQNGIQDEKLDTRMGGAEEDDPDDDVHAPHHMTTRTRARAEAAPSSPTPARSLRSSSPSSSNLPSIHPFFLVPNSVLPASDLGLPHDQADETRRLLCAYVQRQEEVCRGVRSLYEGLMKAKRTRDKVLEWCTSEAHVGEMSDGEDWVDAEMWNLEEGELKKGEEVADEEDEGVRGKKRSRRTAGA